VRARAANQVADHGVLPTIPSMFWLGSATGARHTTTRWGMAAITSSPTNRGESNHARHPTMPDLKVAVDPESRRCSVLSGLSDGESRARI
jgi:hypothetical protein